MSSLDAGPAKAQPPPTAVINSVNVPTQPKNIPYQPKNENVPQLKQYILVTNTNLLIPLLIQVFLFQK